MGPSLLEAFFRLSRLIAFMLGLEALDQSDQCLAVVRMPQKIRTVDRFRFRRPIGQQERRPQMMPHGQRPERRLRVWQPLFYPDRFLEQPNRVIVVLATGGNLS